MRRGRDRGRDPGRGARGLAAALSGCAALALAGQAAAWTALDPSIPRWPALPVAYQVNPGQAPASISSVAVLRVDQGFAAWAAPPCTIWATQNAGDTVASYDYDDGINSIGWIGTEWPHELGPADAIIGFTIPTWDASGALVDVDTVLNAVGFCWNDTGAGGCVDTLSILTHEEGHFLGLGHTGAPGATMWAGYQGGDAPRTLEQDDVDGVCALYPLFPPWGTGTTTPGGGASGCQGCSDDAAVGACAAEQQACAASAECQAFYDCISACPSQSCADDCAAASPAGAELRGALFSCVCSTCAAECAEACAASGAGGAGGAGGAPSGAPGDTGCACSAAPRPEPPLAALLLAAALGALRARRRTAARSSSR
ncbi:MAG: matrixin family metalloprotease [Polyangiaceae bacterium]|nr:matrixin family metalloprotease [Polyangiaceae bacterium]